MLWHTSSGMFLAEDRGFLGLSTSYFLSAVTQPILIGYRLKIKNNDISPDDDKRNCFENIITTAELLRNDYPLKTMQTPGILPCRPMVNKYNIPE